MKTPLFPRTVLFALCFCLGSPFVPSAGAAPSSTLVISQIYGGGGNSGATYKNDFIEIHNISNATVDISGWSVQYTSATGTAWQVTSLSGSIPSGAYYLVQEAAGTGGTASLPTPDAIGSIAMSSTSGKIALVHSTTALSGTAPSGAEIVDLVGFGTANFFEGSPVPALTNSTAALRANNGSTDTDDNAADFSAGSPAPRNGATPMFLPVPVAAKVRVETLADGGGVVVPPSSLTVNGSLTVFAATRTSGDNFVATAPAAWSLVGLSGGIVAEDLTPSADGKSATFTPHAAGTALIRASIVGLASVDSGLLTVTNASTPPTASVSSDATEAVPGQAVTFTVTVVPGLNPASSGLSVTGNLSAIGGSPSQAFTKGTDSFTFTATIPQNLSGGPKTVSLAVADAQSRSATVSTTINVRGNLTILHTNDTHARVTPHKWVIPGHSNSTATSFEDVGGIAYMGGKILQLASARPDALVLDGGDISEGNPIGDWNGPGSAPGTFGDGTIVDYYKLLNTKLRAMPARGGRGLDAMVVGNHDIRDISYLQNMRAASVLGDPANGFHILSMNLCKKGTHEPYFEATTTVSVNGNKVGIIGYTTESADSPEPEVNNLIDVVKCDWSSSDTTKIHLADLVNDLRKNQGCNLVILLTHMGHSGLCTQTTANPTPVLEDTPAAKLPEIVVSGHWHTYCDTVWQPVSLNGKTLFTEAGSFQHYVGELDVNGHGVYQGANYHPLRNSAITPDPEIAAYLAQRKADYAAANPAYGVDQVIGYTADDLLLDNYMKWWSADEYPWSGNNSAGNWICDAVQWKAAHIFGQCDLSLEAGGGVRSDIVAGPVKYTNIYETFPWADDTIYRVNMTGQQIWDYFKAHNCDAAMSSGWHVTAYDGVPTGITFNGNPVDLAKTYKVAINNYMYLHDTVNFSAIDASPQTSTYLARTALMEFTAQFGPANPYSAGPPRYSLNTEFSGGYRAVVTMMNDADSKPAFEDGFIRILSALPETLAHRGTPQVPNDLIRADGSANRANRLTENEWYRSYLGFKNGALKPGDIVEIWGKGAFFGGNPEFVDQEGVQGDGVEFKVVGHDDSLSKPTYFPSIGGSKGFWNDTFKNHYVKFYARKTGASTVSDNLGTVITIQDVTGYAAKPLPGNTGEMLAITGVPTSENFSLRFRADTATVAASPGFPPESQVTQPAAEQTASPLALAATASAAQGAGQNTYSILPSADATVSSGNPASNNGGTTTLFVQSSSLDSFKNERAWLRFDLSGIPGGSAISSASLKMYCWRAQGAPLGASLHGATDDSWVETGTGGIAWNSQPTLGAVLDTQTLSLPNAWYSWDATSFVQSQFSGDKTATLAVKASAEDSSDATAPQYRFDSKEYSGFQPYLQVTTGSAGTPPSVAQVEFFYRYSADGTTDWTPWASFQTVAAPGASGSWNASFNYPKGYGYYEFRSVATDSVGSVEPEPPFADASVHYAAPAPALAVEQPAGTPLASGGRTVDFGNVPVGGNRTLTFSIRNDGVADLTGIQLAINDSSLPATYTLGGFPATLAPGSNSTLQVTCSPSAPGPRNASLQISSSDPRSPFVVALSGNALSRLEAWRQSHFGSILNTGVGADSATPMPDRIPNLVKFATGMDPALPGPRPLSLEMIGNNIVLTYSRSKEAGADGVALSVEWTENLQDAGSWTTVGVTEAVTDQGNTEKVTATIPLGGSQKKFVRLKVSRP